MKNGYKIVFGLMVMLLLSHGAFAQITIATSDVETAIINTQWVSLDDSLSGTYDLGSASSSPQTWDFSSIPLASSANKDTLNYFSASGHWRAEEFPDADACNVASFSQIVGGIYTMTMTTTFYYGATNDGGYLLGGAVRTQFSPTPPPGFPYPEDTTVVLKFQQMGFPLPLTYGVTHHRIDTTFSPDGSMDIQEKWWDVNGFGSMVFPGGATKSVIRVVYDRIETDIDDEGEVTVDPKERRIIFYAQDLTEVQFDVDTTYSGGTTTVMEYDYDVKIGVLGVRATSNVIPETFSLSQNYPNPFNPETNFEFRIPAHPAGGADYGFVSLRVYDMLGREIATLINQQLHPGIYQASWDASNMPSGMYVYRLTAGEFVQTRKMLLTR
ncbi:MAG: T9SS type A sorting domain-containing protein [Ignavibacteriae bacterium]|nr:T9SS type A sorting domain-containing protein [Ignavibacteriota bacterium]